MRTRRRVEWGAEKNDARPSSEGAFQVRIGPKRTRVRSAPKADDWDGARACVEAALEAAAIEGGRCTLRVSAKPMGGL